MKKLLIVTALLSLTATFALAAPPPPGRALAMTLTANAPYSASRVTEKYQLLVDGNEIKTTQNARVYRDSAGRERADILDPNGAVKSIELKDIDGRSYTLDPISKTAVETTVIRPALQAKGAAPSRIMPRAKSEYTDLGTREMEGLLATGNRSVMEMPVNRMPNDSQTYRASVESWSATDQAIPLYSKSTSQLYGDTTVQLSNVVLGEPAVNMLATQLAQYTLVERPAMPTPAP